MNAYAHALCACSSSVTVYACMPWSVDAQLTCSPVTDSNPRVYYTAIACVQYYKLRVNRNS